MCIIRWRFHGPVTSDLSMMTALFLHLMHVLRQFLVYWCSYGWNQLLSHHAVKLAVVSALTSTQLDPPLEWRSILVCPEIATWHSILYARLFWGRSSSETPTNMFHCFWEWACSCGNYWWLCEGSGCTLVYWWRVFINNITKHFQEESQPQLLEDSSDRLTEVTRDSFSVLANRWNTSVLRLKEYSEVVLLSFSELIISLLYELLLFALLNKSMIPLDSSLSDMEAEIMRYVNSTLICEIAFFLLKLSFKPLKVVPVSYVFASRKILEAPFNCGWRWKTAERYFQS